MHGIQNTLRCYMKHYDVNGYVVDKHVDVADDAACSKKKNLPKEKTLASTDSRITDLSLQAY